MKHTRMKVLKFIMANGLLASGNKVVVAFSGGADSRALLDMITTMPDLDFQVVIAHLNHCLRGDESEEDELFVRSVADNYALPLEISRLDIVSFAEERGLSLEEAGRDARRSFFLNVAEKHSADAVVLGHHQDDQAETVLMRLIRGAAGSGLTGMQPKVPGNIFVRPLLCLTRTEIEGYLRKGSLQWREDSSNTDIKFLRNRVRHELLPLLKKYNKKMTENLNRIAQALAADEELLEAVVGRVWRRIATTSSEDVRINLDMLRNELPALRKRLYRKALFTLRGDLRRISSQHLADIDRLASGNKGSGKISLPTGVHVIREYNSMLLTTLSAESVRGKPQMSVVSCGSYHLGHKQMLLVERVASTPANWLETGDDTIFLDLKKIPFPWKVRYLTDGDHFVPFGMRGRKKLKDLFIDKKIPRAARKNIPLLLCDDEIFWVGGVQVAEKTRITDSSGELLRLHLISDTLPDRH